MCKVRRGWFWCILIHRSSTLSFPSYHELGLGSVVSCHSRPRGRAPTAKDLGAFWICRWCQSSPIFSLYSDFIKSIFVYSKISTEIYCSICRLFNKQAEVSLKKLSSGHDNVSSVFEIKIVVKNFHFGSSSSQRYLLVLFVLCLF